MHLLYGFYMICLQNYELIFKLPHFSLIILQIAIIFLYF